MGKEGIPWLYSQDILAHFSNDASKARVLYQDFTNQGVGESKRMAFHHGSHLGQILGDDHFAERALSASGQSGMVKPPSVEEIIKAVCLEYNTDQSALYEQGRGRTHSEARAMAALIIQGLEGITLTSLAKETGRELSSLSQAAGRLRQRMAGNKSLQKKVDKIMASIKTPTSSLTRHLPASNRLHAGVFSVKVHWVGSDVRQRPS